MAANLNPAVKPRLLVILNRLVIGGQTLDTIPLLYRLQDDFDILILYGCREEDEAEAAFLLETFKNIPSKPVTSFKRSFRPLRDLRAFFSILRSIRSFKPGIVHTHGMKSGLFGRTAAWLCSAPCIFHTFHGHHFHSYFNRFTSKGLVLTERLLARLSTKIIAISITQQQELAFTYKIAPAVKIEVIPLGIDESLFTGNEAEKRASFRSKYKLAAGTVAVGIIGRIVPIKNYDLFARVVNRMLAPGVNNIVFFVIGDGHEKAAVQQQLTAMAIPWQEEAVTNVPAPVIFTSWLPEVSKALYGLDIIILTSHNEGTPMSLIEAQFCGKPVVATNVGGVKDSFTDGETGFLIPPNNDAAFVEKLALLTSDGLLRDEMGKKAMAFARQRFSKSREANALKLLYTSCALV